MRLIVNFIDDHKDEYGVEPIVRALSLTCARIAVSSYYAFKKRLESPRSRRDSELLVVIRQIFKDNYSCFGARKIWHVLNNEYSGRFGHVARCTALRLMTKEGICGLTRKKKRPATVSADPHKCPEDLVHREFSAQAANCLWVADITYVPTRSGWVYTTFILDVYDRMIVGWQVANYMRESLARDALTMAFTAKVRAGEDTTGLVHHSDRGVQFRAIRYSETLGDAKAVASVGSKGDSYDNAMAEALNSVYKGELIDTRVWSGLIEVMAQTARWVGWYNHHRPHSRLGYLTPAQAHTQWVDAQKYSEHKELEKQE